MVPIALLASTISKERIDVHYSPEWIACNKDMPPFEFENEESVRGIQLCAQLEKQINLQASPPAHSQWFLRQEDGSAAQWDRPAEGNQLPADKFPSFLLRQTWQDTELNGLVNSYIKHLSPYLLTLHRLSEAERASLEKNACRYPLLIYELHHLYPEIIQTQLIKRAIVEAQLRMTNT